MSNRAFDYLDRFYKSCSLRKQLFFAQLNEVCCQSGISDRFSYRECIATTDSQFECHNNELRVLTNSIINNSILKIYVIFIID